MSEDAALDEFANQKENEGANEQSVYLGPKEVNIPVEWDVTNLGEKCETIYRYPTYYDIEYAENGVPEIRPELIQENGELVADKEEYRYISKDTAEEYPRTELKPYDFVLSVRGTIGQVGLVRPELGGANITANLIRLSPKYGSSNPEFLKQTFLSYNFQQLLETYSTRTTIKTITSDALRSIQFRHPPLSEQRKIATVLHTVDRAIKKTEEILRQIDVVQRGLLRSFFGKGKLERSLDAETKIERIGPKQFQVPVTWETTEISSIGKVITGDTPSTDDESNFGGTLPFVTPETLAQGKYITKSSRTLSESGRNEVKPIPEGSVMMGCIGDIGKVAIANCEAATNQQINSVVIEESEYLPEFLYYHLRILSDFIKSQAGQTTIPIVNKSTFKSFTVLNPPIEEQRKIVGRLSDLDECRRMNRGYLSDLTRLKQGLMQDLLSGKVRTTDTNIQVPDEITQHG
jgi:type I restriction enzyme S subunit